MLAPDEGARLVKLLRMLSSPHDGERAAAAAKASAFVKERGLDWADLLRQQSADKMLRYLLRSGRGPTQKECFFLEKLEARGEGYELTPRQFGWLKSIYQRSRALAREVP